MQKKKIKVLPHEVICPDGMMIEANPNESILDACLRNVRKLLMKMGLQNISYSSSGTLHLVELVVRIPCSAKIENG